MFDLVNLLIFHFQNEQTAKFYAAELLDELCRLRAPLGCQCMISLLGTVRRAWAEASNGLLTVLQRALRKRHSATSFNSALELLGLVADRDWALFLQLVGQLNLARLADRLDPRLDTHAQLVFQLGLTQEPAFWKQHAAQLRTSRFLHLVSHPVAFGGFARGNWA